MTFKGNMLATYQGSGDPTLTGYYGPSYRPIIRRFASRTTPTRISARERP
jgi:hypothetical protein